MADNEIKPSSLWINVEREDKSHGLRDKFFKYTIQAGADSLEKIMAVTYLSQFENRDCEFARRPIYAPDFVVCFIPFSSKLLRVFNDCYHRGVIQSHTEDGQNLYPSPGPMGGDLTPCSLQYFLQNGAQLARLYLANKKNLERFQGKGRELFIEVHGGFIRDRKSSKKYTVDVRRKNGN